MNRTNQLLAKVFAALVLLVSAPALMAMEKVTLPFWEIVSCPSEDIEIEGTVRFQTQQVEGADHTTWVFQAFWSGGAVGLASGAKYRLTGKWMEVIHENPPFIFRWNDHFRLIGQGTAPNFGFYNKVKIVVNANGDVIIDLQDVEWPCLTIAAEIG